LDLSQDFLKSLKLELTVRLHSTGGLPAFAEFTDQPQRLIQSTLASELFGLSVDLAPSIKV